MITPNEYSEQDVEDALLRNAYAEGRKDEREASCVDELVSLVKGIDDAYESIRPFETLPAVVEGIFDPYSVFRKIRALLIKLDAA